MRELTMEEIGHVSGGNTVLNLITAFKYGWAVGTAYYNSLSTEEQDAIGGSIDAALDNFGIKDAEDVH